MSYYQSFKVIILDVLAVSKDAIHIHVGFLSLAVFLILSRKKLSSPVVLVPGFSLSLLMELLDLRDHYVTTGSFEFGASFHDLINTNLIPVALVLLAKKGVIKC